MENKRQKFVRLAESRTNKVLHMLSLLSNCANKSNYTYNDDDVRQIFNAIEKAVKNTKNAFIGEHEKEEVFYLK